MQIIWFLIEKSIQSDPIDYDPIDYKEQRCPPYPAVLAIGK